MKQPKLKELPEKYEPGFVRKMDKRTEISQRLTAAYHNIVADAGGFKVLSHVRLALIERFVFLVAILEKLEQQIANNPKSADDVIGKWTQACNALLGVAKTIGLEKSKAALPELDVYLKGKRA